jgi:uncharacterized damage-inducible protein DinB
MIRSMTRVQDETLSLEDAMPEATFNWRPAKGVRSVAEVYLHIANAIFIYGSKAGGTIPADIQALMKGGSFEKFETHTTKKDAIKGILTKAFAFYRATVQGTPDSALEDMANFFGKDMPKRLLLINGAMHSAEHLGQAIAYARQNGVVPPWSQGSKE